MSEYIGSRISLISKSDIKYIGTLHEINSEKHTVALENVTSYGTEGRKGNAEEEIAGSNMIYAYIVFRGSDVKELTIVAPPAASNENEPPQVPNDPAILGSARPAPQAVPQHQPPPNQDQYRGPPPPYPQQHPQFGYGPPPNQFQNQPRFQGPGAHGFPGSPGAVPGYGPGFGPPPGYFGGPPPGPGFQQHQGPPGQFPPNQQMPRGPPPPQMNQQQPQQMQPQQQQPVGSQNSTPQPAGSQPPPPAQSTKPNPVEMSAGTPETSFEGPPLPAESKPSVAAATAPSQPPQAKAPPRVNSRVAVPLPAAGLRQRPAATNQPAAPAAQPQTMADATQAATAAVAAAMAKLNQDQIRPQADGTDNLTQQVNQMRIQDQHRGGRGRGRGGAPRGARASRTEVPKEDFDFETSNAKFNKQDLVKEAIASGSPIGSPTNGERADPLADTNGHANGEESIHDTTKATGDKGYDKKSSFFDNISSDLKDRIELAQQENGVDGRAIRREERSKNMETFGQGSVDGGLRGGYRGRGRGRGFNNNNNYRGGFRGRGGFDPNRGPAGYRGRGRGGVEQRIA